MLALFLLSCFSMMGQIDLKECEYDKNWYVLPEGSKYTLNEFVSSYKETYGLSLLDSFCVETMDADKELFDNNYSVYKLKHVFSKVPVENSQMIVFVNKGFVEFAYGEILNNVASYVDINRTKIEKSLSFEKATSVLKNKFAWESDELEYYIKDLTDDSTATFYPTGVDCKIKKIGNQIYLVDNWFLSEYDEFSGIRSFNVSVDSYTGEVVDVDEKNYNGIGNCKNAEVITLYYGRKYDMQTKYFGFHTYGLKNCNKISSTNRLNLFRSSFGRPSFLTDSDNIWTSVEERPVTTAHWAACKVQDYFKNYWGISGLGGNTIQIIAGQNYDVASFRNAYYYASNKKGKYSIIELGKNSLGKYYSTVDIIAHEYAHGIISYSSKLVNYGEAGALNESFADIFSNLAERYVLGRNNWTLGEDIGVIRDMENPICNYYKGENWINTNDMHNDNGGVHTNSGVQNRWFYLIVSEMGLDKAKKIVVWTERFLHPTSNYNDVKTLSIMFAERLFGRCSDEHCIVINAWKEVGVSSMSSSWYCHTPYHIIPRFIDFSKKKLLKQEQIIVYPNPACDILNIKLFEKETVEIISMNGNVVKHFDMATENMQLDISDLSNGAYVVRVGNKYSQVITINR